MPVTVPPSPLIAAVGAGSVVRSGATTLVAGDRLPAASACVTDSVSPSIRAGVSVALKVPFAAIVVVAMAVPCGSRMVTIAPASPVPVIVAPSPLSTTTGAAGGVLSGVRICVASEVLPAPSRWVTVSGAPSIRAGDSATAKLPSPATSAVPSTAPAVSRTVTVAPASPVPATDRPSPATLATGAAGAVMSGAVSGIAADGLPA